MPLESGQKAKPGDESEPPDHSESGPEPARRLRARSHLLARREVEQALAKLDARGELTDAQRLIVEAMAHRIAESVLEPPTEALATGDPDPETTRAVRALFEPEKKA